MPISVAVVVPREGGGPSNHRHRCITTPAITGSPALRAVMTAGNHARTFDTPLPIDDALPRAHRRARAPTTAPCWWRRRAPARPRACRWCCSTSRGRGPRKSWCWSRAGWPPAPPPRAWRRRWASRSATPWACACASAPKISKRTRIEVVTEGVFTRLVLDDPSLDGVAAVLFDEFHERSLGRRSRAGAGARRAAGPARGLEAAGHVGDARRRARRGAAWAMRR